MCEAEGSHSTCSEKASAKHVDAATRTTPLPGDGDTKIIKGSGNLLYKEKLRELGLFPWRRENSSKEDNKRDFSVVPSGCTKKQWAQIKYRKFNINNEITFFTRSAMGQSWAVYLGRGCRLHDLQRCLPTSATLQCCEISLIEILFSYC